MENNLILICTKCGLYQSTDNFSADKTKKSGFYSSCKSCVKQYKMENIDKIKEYKREYDKKYREDNKESIKKYRKINKERIHMLRKEWTEKNPDKVSQMNRRYSEKHPDKTAASYKKWRVENPDKYLESQKKWKLNNHHIVISYNNKRRTIKLKACPSWISNTDKIRFEEIYLQAKSLEKIDGIKRNVDHIHPLVNDLVCGLHVPLNLQILTAKQNLEKSNKFESYVESELELHNLELWQVIDPNQYNLSIDISEVA